MLTGCYRVPRAAFEARGGLDACTEVAEGRIRTKARDGGHEPRGRVTIAWYDGDPGMGPAADKTTPYDPEWKWCRVATVVTLHAARTTEVRLTCPSCGDVARLVGGTPRCPTCDRS